MGIFGQKLSELIVDTRFDISLFKKNGDTSIYIHENTIEPIRTIKDYHFENNKMSAEFRGKKEDLQKFIDLLIAIKNEE